MKGIAFTEMQGMRIILKMEIITLSKDTSKLYYTGLALYCSTGNKMLSGSVQLTAQRVSCPLRECLLVFGSVRCVKALWVI